MNKIEIEAEELQRIQSENTRLTSEVKTLTQERDTALPWKVKFETATVELGTLRGQLGAVTQERDDFKKAKGELDDKFVKLTNTTRERDFIDAIVAEAPHVDRKIIRGLIVEAAEKGQI